MEPTHSLTLTKVNKHNINKYIIRVVYPVRQKNTYIDKKNVFQIASLTCLDCPYRQMCGAFSKPFETYANKCIINESHKG